MKHIIYSFVFLVCFILQAKAAVKLPEIIGDDMVLQQNTEVNIWGETTPGKTVEITTSWTDKKFTAKAGNDGKWVVKVSTPEASYTPQQITISDGDAITLTNILIGEVWFCSGQSNMEMPLRGFWNNPIEGANRLIATSAQYKNRLRVATVPQNGKLTPQEYAPGKWKVASPENTGEFTATGTFFALMLNEALDVPIGLINCSWGGSTVEGWTKKEILETYPDIDLSIAGSDKVHPMLHPMIMYNGMLHPLTNYTIKGFLWYQGESNVGRHDTYPERLNTMVNLWREEFGNNNLPFYYVEIAPYEYGEGDMGAYLREAQYKAQELISNSGMVSTNDLVETYEKRNIHPKNKKDIGERLAYMALANTYGMQGKVAANGPEYRSMKIEGDKIHISFNYAQYGFNREDENIVGFEIAGEDQIFYPAKATVEPSERIIIVSSEQVQQPVAVRYGFRNFLPGNLYNTRELPTVPFRTDNW